METARILIADDEEGVRESLRLILGERYQVDVVHNGEEALARLAAKPFDLLLTDVKMPKLGGLDILRRLRKQRKLIPVLVLSAYHSIEVAKEAVRLGAFDYIPKPFDQDHVLRVVHDALTQPAAKPKKARMRVSGIRT